MQIEEYKLDSISDKLDQREKHVKKTLKITRK